VRVTAGETPADTQVEVAHEALVRNWPTLVDWLEQEKVALAIRRRLEGRAAEWVRLGRGSGGLLDEVELREAERWLAGAEAAYLGYDPALPELVAASRAAIAAVVQKQRSAYQRLRLLTFALIGALIAALVATVVAFDQRNGAHEETIARTTAEADAQNHAATAEAERVAAQAALDLLVARSTAPTPTSALSPPTAAPIAAAPTSPTAPTGNPGPPPPSVFAGTIVKQTADTAAGCGAARASSIYGLVEDADGKGIGGAMVRVSDQDHQHSFDIRTTPAGSFLVTTLGCTTWVVDLVALPNGRNEIQSNRLIVKGLNGGQLSAAEIRFQQQR
jgi:type II secretory pathway pseudopilin PulG